MKSGTERIVRIVGCLMAFFNFLLLVQPINAQTSGKVSVKGVVLDEAGETLPGATVTEKGTKMLQRPIWMVSLRLKYRKAVLL